MRTFKNYFSLFALFLLVSLLTACQMQTLYTGNLGTTSLQITLPKSLPSNIDSIATNTGSSSRLLLSNSGFLSVVVRQDGAVVTTQNYLIKAGASSVQVSLTLQLGKDYVIEANAYDTQGGTIICQGIIYYNSTKNGAIAACTMVPYTSTSWPLLTPKNNTFNVPVKANMAYTMQVDMRGQFGIVVYNQKGFETYIQDNDGSPINGTIDGNGKTVVYASDLRNPNLPLYLTYYNFISSNSSITGQVNFPKPIDIVYNGAVQADIDYAYGLKKLLESKLFKANTVYGTPTLWNVNLIDQAKIPPSYSASFTLSGGTVLMTPGTTFNAPGPNYMIHNLLNANDAFITVGNAYLTLDVISSNYAKLWGYTDQAPSALTQSAFVTVPKESSLYVMSSATWTSPLGSSAIPAPGGLAQWNGNGGDFIGYISRAGTPPTNGALHAQDTTYTYYYPVVSQGRFMHIGMPNLPDNAAGQVFLTNCIAKMAK